jgi:hypothetical protein
LRRRTTCRNRWGADQKRIQKRIPRIKILADSREFNSEARWSRSSRSVRSDSDRECLSEGRLSQVDEALHE